MFILIWFERLLVKLHFLLYTVGNMRQYAFVGLLLLLLYGFSLLPVLNPGIEQPSAVEPYFNGVFPDRSPSGTEDNWEVEPAFPNLTFQDPMALLEIPGEQAYYVIGKDGRFYRVPDISTTTTKEVVLDFSSKVDTDGDSGVMNAVLHPEFGRAESSNRGYIYVLYRYHPNIKESGCGTNGFIRLSRFNRPDGSTGFDPASEFVLVQIFDKYCWHVGGGMFFDAEGYFYFTIGDAGEVNPGENSAQKIDERMLSGLFRIDLEMDPSRSHPIRRQQVDPYDVPNTDETSYAQGYYIPNDNPWQDENGSVLEEFYALGFRSPHRASMDEITGDIYVGDVGEGTREEISIVTKGSNLQWPFGEGAVSGVKPAPASIIGISTAPIFDYGRATGNAVIGGFVYRGDKFQGLEGRYLFGDHGVRNIWTLNPGNGEVQFLLNVPGFGEGSKNGISSFATNAAGDVFILKLYGQDMDGGVIYKIKRSSAVPEPPALLSQTGVFSDLTNLTAAPGLVPYQVNSPLWSDGAEKKRWIALPNNGLHDKVDEQITFSETGSWQFPSGTVFVKHFELPVDFENPGVTKRVETRFLVITKSGGAYGLTYKWREDGSDAELLTGRDTRDFSILNGPSDVQTWDFPSRTDCMTCHNANAQFVLGANTWQLNGDLTYPSGVTDNQLNTWQHLKMFANPFNPADIPEFLQSKAIDDVSASPEVRVRSYLDANCAHCHRPSGVEGAFDARFSTPLPQQNLVNIPGISRNTPDGHYVIKPKDTSLSELWLRDGAIGLNAMPPLAKKLVDEKYMSVLTEWINGLDAENCYPATVSGLEFALPPQNYDGPVEINTSNGGGKSGDGNPITIAGQVFAKGLGVHAYSEVTYALNGQYMSFESYIGVDDETKPYCLEASVQFEVFLDGTPAFKSDVMKPGDPAEFVKLNVSGVNEMKLVVSDSGDGPACDHADWANPTLLPCVDCDPGGSCDDGDPCTSNDQYDAICNCVGTLIDADGDGVCDTDDVCPGSDDKLDADADGIPDGCDEEYCPIAFLSDLSWTGDPTNGSGPVRLDRSNGNRKLTINGRSFDKGLGVHSYSEISYDISGQGYETFKAFIGVDDECASFGSVAFKVYTDGDLAYESPVMTYTDDAVAVQVALTDVKILKLVVTDGDGNSACDHADWAYALLERCCTAAGVNNLACDDGDPCTANDTYDGDCNCVGEPAADSDNDGVCDLLDQCPGHDDRIDTDNDGFPDACDPCIGVVGLPCDDGDPCTTNDFYNEACNCIGEPLADSDEDGVCDLLDQCPGSDDTADADGDGVADACDLCPGFDDKLDIDNDGVPDGCDPCTVQAGLPCDDGDPCTVNDVYDEQCGCIGESTVDSDEDGVCDALDQCPDFDDSLDADQDGVPDGCDQCPGSDDKLDLNENGLPDDCECRDTLDSYCGLNDCSINSIPIPSDLFFAANLFSSRGLVAADSSVIFSAGLAVVLQPGFHAQAGTNFRAKIQLDCEASASEEVAAALPAIIPPTMRLMDNPNAPEITVLYEMERAGTVELRLSDPSGQEIVKLQPPVFKEAGIHELRFTTPDLPPGAYQVGLQHANGVVSEKFMHAPNTINRALEVKVRPNPFHHEFTLFIKAPLPEMKRAIVRILDTSGRIFYQKLDAPFDSEFTITPQPGWGNGLYILQVQASDYYAIRNIVKQ